MGHCTFIWAKLAFGCVKRFDMVKDTIGMLVLTALVIALGTNFVTETHNIWALMSRYG
jgi:hypothetical protein